MGFSWVLFAYTQTRPKECPSEVQVKPKRIIRDGSPNLLGNYRIYRYRVSLILKNPN